MAHRILLVEDDPLAQDIITAILRSQGFEIDAVEDGFAAMKLLQENTHHTALVDYHLPEMDGYALARLMRNISKTRELPLRLVGITADRHGLAARRGANALFDAIVAKPLDPQELIRSVEPETAASHHDEIRDAATRFLADPQFDQARRAAKAFWRVRGLDDLPKAIVIPDPTPDRANELSICFDLADEESADLVILLDAAGLQALARLQSRDRHPILPVVTLDKSLSILADAWFNVGDPISWSGLAQCLQQHRLKIN